MTEPKLYDLYDRVHAAAQAVRAHDPVAPEIGLILGSGLGGFADGFARATAIDYGDIPHFPRSHVVGHKARHAPSCGVPPPRQM